MNLDVPKVGMRTIKTAVAVVLAYLVFVPIGLLVPVQYSGGSAPFYACIAAVICMQSSVDQTVNQGISRLIGTAIGGCLGLLLLAMGNLLSSPMIMCLTLGAGTILCIWVCNLIKQPSACSISVVVLCVILFNHTGPDRYSYALNRMFETGVGVMMAVVVNRALPDHREKET